MGAVSVLVLFRRCCVRFGSCGHAELQGSAALWPFQLQGPACGSHSSKELLALSISLVVGLSLLNELHQRLDQVFFTHRGFADLSESSLVPAVFGGLGRCFGACCSSMAVSWGLELGRMDQGTGYPT